MKKEWEIKESRAVKTELTGHTFSRNRRKQNARLLISRV
jgi:hypothetical protein